MFRTFWKIIFFIAGLVFLALAVNGFFSRQLQEAGNLIQPARLKALTVFHDFGIIPMVVGKKTHSFGINNVSQESVEIGKFYTSCRCVTASLIIDGKKVSQTDFLGGATAGQKEIILPNQTAIVEVVFDPAAEGPSGTGLRENFVYLEDKGGVSLKLSVRALVKL